MKNSMYISCQIIPFLVGFRTFQYSLIDMHIYTSSQIYYIYVHMHIYVHISLDYIDAQYMNKHT